MGKILLLVLIAIVVSIAIYMGFGSDAYFLIRIGDWAMQVTLFVACLLAITGLVVIRIFWRLFRGIFLGAWPAAWRRRQKQNLVQQAIENLAITNWGSARKDLVRLANQADKPAPWVILSAQASEALGELEEAKTVYKRALVEFPEWSNVVYPRLCQISLEEGDLEQAEIYIDEIARAQKDSVEMQLLKAQIAEERQDGPRLLELLSGLRKRKSLHNRIAQLERRYLRARLDAHPGTPELLEIKNYVLAASNLPEDIISKLSRQLALRGHGKDAEVLVRKALGQHWSEELMVVYAELDGESPKRQLKMAEGWLSARPESEALLAGLQKLALRAGDDAKADNYAAKVDNLPRLAAPESTV